MHIENAKVLIIDDDPVMTLFVVNILNRLGVRQVEEATNGNAGLVKVSRFRPDLVLSDIHMATMGGLEFVKRLRELSDPALRKTPVLLMSADSSTQTLNDSVPLGIAGYIIKPPILSTMKIKLEQVLKFREARQPANEAL